MSFEGNLAVKEKKQNEKRSIFRFLVPSLIGVLLFMIPIKYNGELTITVAIFSKHLQHVLDGKIQGIMVFLILVSTLMSLLARFTTTSFIENNNYFKSLFKVSSGWLLTRVLGCIFVIMAYFKIGPSFIYADSTGGLLLNDLLPVLFSVFLFAGMLIPLLLNFGLLELCGALLTKVMRPLFSLPGRSSVDCIASWLGDGTIGVLLTSRQYEEGFYNQREAAVIGTTFSAVSITFSLVVLAQVGLEHMFGQYYLTILVAGIIAAIIVPRIPPLSKKSNLYINNVEKPLDESIPSGYTPLSWGIEKAVDRAYQEKNSAQNTIKEGAQNVLDMWLGVAPVVMALGTLALVIAEYTPIFEYLGIPFIPYLNLLGVPEAVAASKTLVVGFADMFLPSVIGASIQSEMTRFIVAATSVTQLIYMSEVGGLLIGSKIPVNMKDLIIIFLERTIITLPIVVFMAHLFF